ncbi:unnamed protein product [Notodromas monacha]|uniref:Uncharacterized protein n=1 Tax=Notodromas monacha TaxID=399045 RepID=A0A7R9BX41_9CRUS|nr:unnamed protein product [Notodromas monacha]CAG0921712.1 unnamed protein product [Notodromas monacha]
MESHQQPLKHDDAEQSKEAFFPSFLMVPILRLVPCGGNFSCWAVLGGGPSSGGGFSTMESHQQPLKHDDAEQSKEAFFPSFLMVPILRLVPCGGNFSCWAVHGGGPSSGGESTTDNEALKLNTTLTGTACPSSISGFQGTLDPSTVSCLLAGPDMSTNNCSLAGIHESCEDVSPTHQDIANVGSFCANQLIFQTSQTSFEVVQVCRLDSKKTVSFRYRDRIGNSVKFMQAAENRRDSRHRKIPR